MNGLGFILITYMSTFVLMSTVLCICNRNTGPSGTTACIQIPRYNYGYQWSVCLTNTYIETKTNSHHFCEDRTATYCYYQCMLELYNINSGPVNDGCSCKKGDEYNPSNLTLPSECYSPSGTDCTWYKDCLERKYKCSGTDDDYAMEYATKFCNLYSESYDSFSQDGQAWVDSVRKCLQVSLVPTLRPWRTLSCKDVKQTAFDSHVPCYTNPNPEYPSISICNLEYTDRGKIFWTLRSSLTMSFDSSLETMDGFRKTLDECYPVSKGIPSKLVLKLTLRIIVLRGLLVGRRRRSVSNTDFKFLVLANRIADTIAEKLQWSERGVLWFPYVEQNSTMADEIDIYLYIAEGKFYVKDLTTVNINSTINEFQRNVEDGKLEANLGDYSFQLLSAQGCLDVQCNSTSFEVSATYKDEDKSSNGKIYVYLVIGIVAAIVLLLVIVVVCKTRRKSGIA